ncbi:hypothetical protein GF324_00325 [bacterium]|nr:hypothetical protein [bacterium]
MLEGSRKMNDKVKHFRRVLEELDAVLEMIPFADVPGKIVEIANEQKISTLAVGMDEILKSDSLLDSLKVAGVKVVPPPDATAGITAGRAWREEVAAADAGLTGCFGAAAETGSALLPPFRPDVRAVSLLPPLHILLVEQSKLHSDVGTLTASWAEESGEGNAVFVSGPSRTADIEKELVLGVHGPSRVIVVLVTDR